MHTPKSFGALALATLVAVLAVGCKEPEIKQAGGRSTGRTVKATIGTFDPNADVGIDLEKFGVERPDDYAVQMSLNQAFPGMDACVAAVKDRRGIAADTQLSGDLDIQVKLEPKTGKAMAVNATISGKHAKDQSLNDCLRDAVAQVDFPKYDGPPVVAEIYTQLDGGTIDE
jgi:hypothetical protein